MAKSRVTFSTNPKDFFKTFLPKKGSIRFYVEDTPHAYVVGKKGGVVQSKLSTAQIGAIHEYGLGGMPKRSFLEMPLRTKLPEIFRWINFYSHTYKSLEEMFERIAQMAYDEIMTAFETNGFGRWKKLSQNYKKYTGRTEPALTDTGILKDSISCNYKVNKTGSLGKIAVSPLTKRTRVSSAMKVVNRFLRGK